MRPVFHAMAFTFALVIAVVFFRFWRDSRDRFFLLFSVAFAILGVHWTLLAVLDVGEHAPAHYALRLAAFVLLLLAIVDKNRR